jgi:hypothetical protein
MNSKLHKIEKVDWSKFTLTEWLYQFGYWQADVHGAIGFKCTQLSPLYNAIKEAKLKFNQEVSESIIASYFCNKITTYHSRARIELALLRMMRQWRCSSLW